jgi:hypothetical protein
LHRQVRLRLAELVSEALRGRYDQLGEGADVFEQVLDDVVARRRSPHAVASELLDWLGFMSDHSKRVSADVD